MFEITLQTRLAAQLEKYGFCVTPEVLMRHYTGLPLRIDLIAQPLFPFPAEFIGVECKRHYPQFTDFTAALKQAIDYRMSTVKDSRLPSLEGLTPTFVFLFPNINNYEQLAGGAERLAGKFNVGIIKEERGECRLFVNAAPLWGSARGLVSNADTFSTNRHPGHL